MSEDFCRTCGKEDLKENMDLHHILPRSLGGTDIETNLVLICRDCHSKIHNGLCITGSRKPINPLELRALQRVGIERAKKEGKYKGRQPTARRKADAVMAMVAAGVHKQKIANDLNIGVASVYRIIKEQRENIDE